MTLSIVSGVLTPTSCPLASMPAMAPFTTKYYNKDNYNNKYDSDNNNSTTYNNSLALLTLVCPKRNDLGFGQT